MNQNPYQVVRDFEAALCDYTGAPYCVTVTSCTMALLLAVAYYMQTRSEADSAHIEIPKRTYVGVAQSIIHAGGWPKFRNEQWQGWYQLRPLPVWDSARWLTSKMYNPQFMGGHMVCLSFHWSKTLGIQQGGAILLDSPEAAAWLKRARFDGRTEGLPPKEDPIQKLGWHCYMSPETAAAGLVRLRNLPQHNAPLPWDDYPDLSTLAVFK